ncbi:tRNA:m(4)X modification enzyme Trm13p [[Candida] railenensis]|uniref:tRNA:m(4)X modification enzyme TRM13 n=1 Tax=[Candida] railenensis TaxID=45579 RepID=A0A9P0QQJ2_9ASCO|nr:tRNA:m(4)X modification enzyme Trm13p [[Candida] railenensis]
MTLEASKKRKIDKENLQCGYFLERKKRNCRMQRKADSKFCSEHMILSVAENENKDEDRNGLEQQENNVRIPCPNDDRHTIWAKDLEKHLKKCKGITKTAEPWFAEDINSKLRSTSIQVELGDESGIAIFPSDKELYTTYIPILKSLSYPELRLIKCNHPGLDNRMKEVQIKKHAIQQSSLIGYLKTSKLLNSRLHYYLEFGCGKAELSRFVNLSILEDLKKESADIAPSDTIAKQVSYGFGLIDRGVNRMKMDPKIIKDYTEMEFGEQSKPEIHRTRIDIKDLDLDRFMEQFKHAKEQEKKVVCISKHLCGVATDLTLKCMLNSSILDEHGASDFKFQGLLVAMCCRHVCSYDQLLPQSRTYLASKGFADKTSFSILKKMASWAVNGRMEGMTDSEGTEHPSGLTILERESLGQLARRLIDECRLYAIRKLLDQSKYEASIHWYVDREITLENVCLSIKRR